MNQTGRKSALDLYLDSLESGNGIQYITAYYVSFSTKQKLLMTTRNYTLHGSHEI